MSLEENRERGSDGDIGGHDLTSPATSTGFIISGTSFRDQNRLLYEKIEFEVLLALRRHVSERLPRGSAPGVH